MAWLAAWRSWATALIAVAGAQTPAVAPEEHWQSTAQLVLLGLALLALLIVAIKNPRLALQLLTWAVFFGRGRSGRPGGGQGLTGGGGRFGGAGASGRW